MFILKSVNSNKLGRLNNYNGMKIKNNIINSIINRDKINDFDFMLLIQTLNIVLFLVEK